MITIPSTSDAFFQEVSPEDMMSNAIRRVGTMVTKASKRCQKLQFEYNDFIEKVLGKTKCIKKD